MFKSLQVNHLSLPHLVYSLIVAGFMLAFFLLPNEAFPDDQHLHKAFIFGVLIFFPFIARDIWRNTSLLKHPLFYCMVAYFIYSAISGFWTVPDEVEMSLHRPFVRSLYIIIFCLAVAWLSLLAPDFFDRLLTILLFTAALVAFASIIYWWVSFGGDFSVRLMGITRAEHSIQGAASFAVIFLLALVRFNSSQTLLMKMLCIAAALVCLLFVILAQTRGVLVAVLAAGFMFFVVRRDLKPLLVLSGVAFILLCLSFYWIDWLGLWEGLTRSMPYRMEMWETVFKQSLERPWFGHGFLHDARVPAEGQLFPHAHNIYISIFFFNGIFGLIFYGIMMLCALYYAYINRSDDKFLFAGLAIIFASVAMLSDIGRVIGRPNDLWFYFWFPIGIILSTPRLIAE